MAKFKISEAGARLYAAGVSYYAHGNTKNANGESLFVFFKLCKAPTAAQIAELLTFCPDMKTAQSSPQYAPEQKNAVLLFPRAAYYRKQGAQA
jgi:hypothetical protein